MSALATVVATVVLVLLWRLDENKGVTSTSSAQERYSGRMHNSAPMTSHQAWYAGTTTPWSGDGPLVDDRRSAVIACCRIDSSFRGKIGQDLKCLAHARSILPWGEPMTRKIFMS